MSASVEKQLREALDYLHGEASRWVYLDTGPTHPSSHDDWEDIAKGRAEFVVHETHAALTASTEEGS